MNGRALFAMPNVPSSPASRLDQNPSKHSERSSAKRRESISICCIPPSPSASPDTAIRVRACLRSFPSMKLRVFQGEKCITHLLHRSRRQAQATRKQQHLFVFRTFAAAFHQNEQSRYTDAEGTGQTAAPNARTSRFDIRRRMQDEFLFHLVLFGASYASYVHFSVVYISR